MTNLFKALFKNKTISDDLANVLLTDSSPLADQPSYAKFPLWTNQRAMLQRCIDIEAAQVQSQKREADDDQTHSAFVKILATNIDRYRNKGSKPPVNETQCYIGIMNDPPGSGKTHVALSLIALDTTMGSTNLVVVPPNLYQQWVEAITSFFPPDSFKWMSISQYQDVNPLYRCHEQRSPLNLNDFKLILTTTMYVEMIANALVKYKFRRVILDEVDTMGDAIINIPECERVWFVSASFDPYTHRKIGPCSLEAFSINDILNLVCRCETSFMIQSQGALDEPSTEIIKIDDGDIQAMKPILNNIQYYYLNSCNLSRVKEYTLKNRDCIVRNLTDLITCMLNENKQLIENLLEQKSKNNRMDNDVDEKLANARAFQETLLRVAEHPMSDNNFKKLTYIEQICNALQSDLSTKWIFFSDDDDMFDYVIPILDKCSVKYTTMREGTPEKNAVALAKFKTDPSVRVILLNSVNDGCGLNIENTSHILFLQYTDPRKHEQVIGRAQRPGRKGRLHVVCLYNENEIIQVQDDIKAKLSRIDVNKQL